MPSKSKAQARAMRAACKGESTLGIPRKVACEFVAADKKQGTKQLPKRKAKK